MAANLAIFQPEVFACAIARTGAYNRTLTPFGFQNEERTLWQVGALCRNECARRELCV